MINFNNVTKVYKSGTEALKNVDLAIKKGEFAFVIGPSGSGKSTIIKLIMKEEAPTGGELYVNGIDTRDVDRYEVPVFRKKIGVVFQDYKLLQNKTAYQNIAFALRVTKTHGRQIRKMVPQLLAVVGLLDKANDCPDELSGGEQQRVAIARAIANNPDLLIADEPTGNLDPKTSLEIMNLIYKINQMGTTVLVATHDKSIVDAFKQRVIVLDEGRVTRDVPEGRYGV
ncbi:MAG: cell division ATP-binding protein FtsE [Clostridiales bacterium]|nr:cell division ATP-binding protein FtsE [Clostridiales bacterium]